MANPILPEVYENGKPVSQERIDPAVASFIFQAVQAAQLAKLRKLEESKIPTGTWSGMYDLTTDVKTILLGTPWISFTIVNAGPGRAKVSAMSKELQLADEAEIDSGQTVNFDFKFPVVTRIYLTSTSTCQVRLYAIEGAKS